ncbi:MAG: hypothetical protein MUO26_11755 [Methanotrichaceae archaeon]|nr:hypothetical protein [Methanotrichaceae archaeon]
MPNFRDFTFIVPALKGYQLAEEIYRHLDNIKVGCIHLKSDTCERLVKSKDLNDINFETILIDTKRHYSDRGSIKETKCGSDISMFYKGENGEEEVLWMEVSVRLSAKHMEPSI